MDWRVIFMVLAFFLAACSGSFVTDGQTTPVTAVSTPPPSPIPSASPTTSPTPAPTLAPTPSPTLPPTATTAGNPTPAPSAAANPYTAFTIDALTAREYGGGLLEIEDTLEQNETFTRYLITYPSDDLTIAGYMNVPNEGDNFPVVIMLHGYIPPDEYETVAYTRRYADDLAEAGFFVIHPNLRNYPPSDSGPNEFRVGMAVDVLNLLAIIREQSQDPLGVLRRADADNIHLWGHSMGGGVALRVAVVANGEYLKTAVLYAAVSGNEQQNYQRMLQWSGGSRGAYELAASPQDLAAISPSNHLDRLNAAISIHHSRADDVVPLAWSEELCQQLQAASHPVVCFTYDDLPHTFRGLGDLQFMERVRLFFQTHSR